MFPLLFRIFTIAGAFTVAAVLTRRYLAKDSEDNNEAISDSGSRQNSITAKPVAAAPPENGAKPASGPAPSSTPSARKNVKQESAQSGDDNTSVKPGVSAQSVSEAEPIPVARGAELVESSSASSPAETPAVKQSKQDTASGNESAIERARVVLESSKQILANYKHPEGLPVDISLAQFSLDTAERLFKQSKYDDAWQKAGAVGMIVGMSEMRASVEKQIKEISANKPNTEQLQSVRNILGQADRFLADASQSFISEEMDNGAFMNHLQSAFQKTTEAQSEILKITM